MVATSIERVPVIWTEQMARRLEEAARHLVSAGLHASRCRKSFVPSLMNVADGLRRLANATRRQRPSALLETFGLRVGLLHRALAAAEFGSPCLDAHLPEQVDAVRDLLTDLDRMLPQGEIVSLWDGDDVAERLDVGGDLLDEVAVLAHRSRPDVVPTLLACARFLRHAADEARQRGPKRFASGIGGHLNTVRDSLAVCASAPCCSTHDDIQLITRAERILAELVIEGQRAQELYAHGRTT